jgi:Mrp family chromosome partitioning ATPase/capsular polysaccharide biosynthesis protein
VRHHPLLVGLVLVATLAVTVAWLQRRAPAFDATAQILVTPTAGDAATAGLPILSDSVDPTRTLQTAATILDSPKAAVVAAGELGSAWSVGRLLNAVNVSAQGDSNVVAVTATSDSERSAIEAANAYAPAALQVRSDSLRSQVDAQLAGLRARRDALGNTDPTASAALAASIAELTTIRDGRDPNFSLLQSATGAVETGASKKLVVVLGLIGGLVIGVGAALALEQLDRRVRDEDGLVETYPLPVLTRVPVVRRRGSETPPQVREAFRTLQVQLDAESEESRVVMLTSASVGDGKTTSAIELSTALVASGFRVVLLDLDLRKPDVGVRLGVRSDVLALFGSAPRLTDALVDVPGYPELLVFSAQPSGDISPVLEALSRRLPELLAQAREMADFVIVDTAPLGRVSDALRVAAVADDVLLVTRPGNTDRNDLLVARELLEHMGVTPTGMVVVGGSGSAYGGYYGYAADSPREGVAPLRPTEPKRRDRRSRDELDALP